MKKTILATTVLATSLAGATSVQADAVTDAIKAGKTTISLRLRNENVERDVDTNDSANAATLRTRLTYQSADIAGISVLAEVDNVTALTDTNYNDGVNGKTTEQKIIDPEYTDVNQFYFQYKNAETTVKLGNQRILLDNQRHVGGVGFRQNEATFDAISVTNTSIPDTKIYLAGFNNRHTITGADTLEDGFLGNVNYKMGKELSLTGYTYLLNDIGGTTDFNTYGLRATGAVNIAVYEVEYAIQNKEVAGADFDTSYYNVAAGVKLDGVTVKLGQELLGSDDGKAAFATPLGTNHKFNGWSDNFLGGNGNDGFEDTYLNVVTKVAGLKLVGQYHSFAGDNSGDDLGSEYGFVVAKKINNYSLSLKASQYDASDKSGKADTTKVWLTATAKF
ncbi:hypothetical protein [Bacterioplanoides sp.]|uniref:hypothetical protein n=1 Tax=Bacterioplanoides sp. TaxID=2066072 RepID=UPI003B5CA005